MQIYFILCIRRVHAFVIACRHGLGIFDRQNIDLISIRDMQMRNVIDTLFRIQLIVAAYDKTDFVLSDNFTHITISPLNILSLMICRTFSLSQVPQNITANNS